ncbi:L-mandelate dehydrogenase [Kockovaella imperatae]|uniref:L-mandelate dehydrogenase n=1 Tax=Kockovaella imperatae TaxID=4999 RepID=A0A1Y1UAV8_9TREE|nr:L-mandelate dehydrogenase [Kockovaella imperatae]ORX35178.1 L-mandelate dehydrogenase [Kockovaella imperatae]
MEEVSRHNLAHDCWIVVDGKVYDVTHFHKNHPGGSAIIVANAGKDVSELFRPIHPPKTLETNLVEDQFMGFIDPKEAAKSRENLAKEVDRIQTARDALMPVERVLSLDEMQAAAESILSDRSRDYYAAGALDSYTREANRTAFHKCRLLPRVMRDVSSVSPQTTIFGQPSALPIYISPASNALLGHPEGELNLTRGAARTGLVQGISAASSFSLTDILDERDRLKEDESPYDLALAYQVYVQTERSRTEVLVKEAVERGVQALLLTADTNVLGCRETTDRIKGVTGNVSPGARMGPFTEYPAYHDAKQCWADLPWLKRLAGDIPIYLKGVCTIEDVRLARDHGLAGCILSNHGGRQLDQARTAFDSLRAIHDEDPELLKQIDIYIDGGIRRGTDVLLALAYGAKGVGLGRPFLWAQTAYGEQGVIRAVRIMESEIVMAMRLLGITRIDQINASMAECIQEVWR